ncbi:MAG: type II secretion system F family protein [Candidatus Omnitrophica bacterium]|nr:type II secretion system F family protein [Candidatus Omnitrophota bacterium]MDD5671918.1 type II secretion system F family protein [Candidatus Omnitrophota bacterium]
MTALIAFLIFITVLSFVMTVSKWFYADREAISERVARQLRGDFKDKRNTVQLERRERLSDLPVLNRLLKSFRPVKAFQTWIRQAGLSVSPGAILLCSSFTGSIGGLASLTLPLGPIASATLVSMGLVLPFVFIMLERLKRKKRFSEGFPDAIARIAGSLRAGYSMQMAIEALLEDSRPLIAEEFRRVLAEMEVGQGFEVALQKMLERIDTPDLRLFIASISIQRESGGNLAELMDNLEATIRQRFELQRELQAAAAQAKFSGAVLSFLPLFVGIALFFIHRNYILFFFQDPIGRNLFWLCITGQVLGFLTIHKLIRLQM